MAVKFETYGLPEPTGKREASVEEIEKIAERVRKSNANLRKAMKRIAIKEAETWDRAWRETLKGGSPSHRG